MASIILDYEAEASRNRVTISGHYSPAGLVSPGLVDVGSSNCTAALNNRAAIIYWVLILIENYYLGSSRIFQNKQVIAEK
jgi:hypothetical protein